MVVGGWEYKKRCRGWATSSLGSSDGSTNGKEGWEMLGGGMWEDEGDSWAPKQSLESHQPIIVVNDTIQDGTLLARNEPKSMGAEEQKHILKD